ncbi:MAG: hypothetical protein A2Z25_03070 [Planctomycetes bacterium RBG_16_55_9]|nr:MAG: hypothetical protein A2Z25_03070 [Planctomycetes bacterium RBG_16_55_9]
MIDCILSRTVQNTGGLLLAFLAFAAYVFIFALIIISLIRASRYFRSAGKEQKLMRIEMGKLAEEMHLLRQDIKGDKSGQAST